ncbi:50S ribosomal protein L29 [Paenactinomyces guangxiensis]|uniref:Large ribosomal subunit protein uL29 n=1 Tax=Paenactinomyces guangxiensis TaxID=1490290 RepID=A0A7W1WU37_9BACL|nr:50S ribosomal protein L29 [Paenactinomyces guangxiensis]MBA4495896.1 50S ribosomal protein L29 [Paenactinomyces guangxiensis]MBH8592967.1 50S ribosomal protein L29 [Paenactinomyces guangxiensis]
MKAKELIELTTAEIEQKLAQYKEELFNLRFQSATGQLDNPARLSQVRKNIARCKTVLRERELGIERRKQG